MASYCEVCNNTYLVLDSGELISLFPTRATSATGARGAHTTTRTSGVVGPSLPHFHPSIPRTSPSRSEKSAGVPKSISENSSIPISPSFFSSYPLGFNSPRWALQGRRVIPTTRASTPFLSSSSPGGGRRLSCPSSTQRRMTGTRRARTTARMAPGPAAEPGRGGADGETTRDHHHDHRDRPSPRYHSSPIRPATTATSSSSAHSPHPSHLVFPPSSSASRMDSFLSSLKGGEEGGGQDSQGRSPPSWERRDVGRSRRGRKAGERTEEKEREGGRDSSPLSMSSSSSCHSSSSSSSSFSSSCLTSSSPGRSSHGGHGCHDHTIDTFSSGVRRHSSGTNATNHNSNNKNNNSSSRKKSIHFHQDNNHQNHDDLAFTPYRERSSEGGSMRRTAAGVETTGGKKMNHHTTSSRTGGGGNNNHHNIRGHPRRRATSYPPPCSLESDAHGSLFLQLQERIRNFHRGEKKENEDVVVEKEKEEDFTPSSSKKTRRRRTHSAGREGKSRSGTASHYQYRLKEENVEEERVRGGGGGGGGMRMTETASDYLSGILGELCAAVTVRGISSSRERGKGVLSPRSTTSPSSFFHKKKENTSYAKEKNRENTRKKEGDVEAAPHSYSSAEVESLSGIIRKKLEKIVESKGVEGGCEVRTRVPLSYSSISISPSTSSCSCSSVEEEGEEKRREKYNWSKGARTPRKKIEKGSERKKAPEEPGDAPPPQHCCHEVETGSRTATTPTPTSSSSSLIMPGSTLPPHPAHGAPVSSSSPHPHFVSIREVRQLQQKQIKDQEELLQHTNSLREGFVELCRTVRSELQRVEAVAVKAAVEAVLQEGKGMERGKRWNRKKNGSNGEAGVEDSQDQGMRRGRLRVDAGETLFLGKEMPRLPHQKEVAGGEKGGGGTSGKGVGFSSPSAAAAAAVVGGGNSSSVETRRGRATAITGEDRNEEEASISSSTTSSSSSYSSSCSFSYSTVSTSSSSSRGGKQQPQQRGGRGKEVGQGMGKGGRGLPLPVGYALTPVGGHHYRHRPPQNPLMSRTKRSSSSSGRSSHRSRRRIKNRGKSKNGHEYLLPHSVPCDRRKQTGETDAHPPSHHHRAHSHPRPEGKDSLSLPSPIHMVSSSNSGGCGPSAAAPPSSSFFFSSSPASAASSSFSLRLQRCRQKLTELQSSTSGSVKDCFSWSVDHPHRVSRGGGDEDHNEEDLLLFPSAREEGKRGTGSGCRDTRRSLRSSISSTTSDTKQKRRNREGEGEKGEDMRKREGMQYSARENQEEGRWRHPSSFPLRVQGGTGGENIHPIHHPCSTTTTRAGGAPPPPSFFSSSSPPYYSTTTSSPASFFHWIQHDASEKEKIALVDVLWPEMEARLKNFFSPPDLSTSPKNGIDEETREKNEGIVEKKRTSREGGEGFAYFPYLSTLPPPRLPPSSLGFSFPFSSPESLEAYLRGMVRRVLVQEAAGGRNSLWNSSMMYRKIKREGGNNNHEAEEMGRKQRRSPERDSRGLPSPFTKALNKIEHQGERALHHVERRLQRHIARVIKRQEEMAKEEKKTKRQGQDTNLHEEEKENEGRRHKQVEQLEGLEQRMSEVEQVIKRFSISFSLLSSSSSSSSCTPPGIRERHFSFEQPPGRASTPSFPLSGIPSVSTSTSVTGGAPTPTGKPFFHAARESGKEGKEEVQDKEDGFSGIESAQQQQEGEDGGLSSTLSSTVLMRNRKTPGTGTATTTSPTLGTTRTRSKSATSLPSNTLLLDPPFSTTKATTSTSNHHNPNHHNNNHRGNETTYGPWSSSGGGGGASSSFDAPPLLCCCLCSSLSSSPSCVLKETGEYVRRVLVSHEALVDSLVRQRCDSLEGKMESQWWTALQRADAAKGEVQALRNEVRRAFGEWGRLLALASPFGKV